MRHLLKAINIRRGFSTTNKHPPHPESVEELNERLYKRYFEDIKQKQPPYFDDREIGPYPVVPPTLYQLKPPVRYHSSEFMTKPSTNGATHYFDPFLRRQFGEPLPEHFELWTVQAPEIEPNYSPAFMLGSFFAAAGVMYSLWLLCQWADPNPHERLPYTSLETESMKRYLSPSAYAEYKRVPQ